MLHDTLLFFHIGAGTTALLAGLTALILRKFSPDHPLAGRVFFYAVLVVSFTAITMSVLKWNPFLLLVGFFTLYQNYAGKRSVENKGLMPNGLDLIMWLTGLVTSIGMLSEGGLVLWVFAAIQMSLVINDMRIYVVLWRGGSLPANAWLRRHLGNMVGTFIAVVTASLVVNVEASWYIWLLPTWLLSPIIIFWNIKLSRKKSNGFVRTGFKGTIAVLALLTFISTAVEAQPYTEAKTRHRFAQLNAGVDFGFIPAAENSAPVNTTEQGAARLIIGGTHFWGHADFFVAFPVAHLESEGYRERVETGFRFFPWRITDKKLRPYLGFSHRMASFQQGDGDRSLVHRIPLSAGLYFNRGAHLIDLGVSYTATPQTSYRFTTGPATSINLPPIGFRLGYRFMLETTLSAEKNWLNGKTAWYTDTLAKLGRLDGFTFGIGPSVSFFSKESKSFFEDNSGFVQPRVGNLYPELMAGYYWHKADLQVSAVFRGFKYTSSAYGTDFELKRRAVNVEAYKFFGDYHGFVPFVGPLISYENFEGQFSQNGQRLSSAENASIRPGVIFGWDIRPDRIQSWYLRTCLRWIPGDELDFGGGKKLNLNQLEVNFIQFVLLPGRL